MKRSGVGGPSTDTDVSPLPVGVTFVRGEGVFLSVPTSKGIPNSIEVVFNDSTSVELFWGRFLLTGV